MRIGGKSGGTSATQGVSAAKPTGAAVPQGVQGSSGTFRADALSVSGPAHFMAVARAHLAGIPDVRTAKVAALRARMEADDYNPDGEAVADGLVREHTPPRRGA